MKHIYKILQYFEVKCRCQNLKWFQSSNEINWMHAHVTGFCVILFDRDIKQSSKLCLLFCDVKYKAVNAYLSSRIPLFSTRSEKSGSQPRLQIIVILAFVDVFWTAHDYLWNRKTTLLNVFFCASLDFVYWNQTISNRSFAIDAHQRSYTDVDEKMCKKWKLPQLLMLRLNTRMDRMQAMLGKFLYLVPRNSSLPSVEQTTLFESNNIKITLIQRHWNITSCHFHASLSFNQSQSTLTLIHIRLWFVLHGYAPLNTYVDTIIYCVSFPTLNKDLSNKMLEINNTDIHSSV